MTVTRTRSESAGACQAESESGPGGPGPAGQPSRTESESVRSGARAGPSGARVWTRRSRYVHGHRRFQVRVKFKLPVGIAGSGTHAAASATDPAEL
jgi:hypothetical protein